jgi:hypothetical protein
MRFRNFRIVIIIAALAALLVVGCAGPSRTVERISADEVVDLSGRWSDTDSRLVAEQMVTDLLMRPWLNNFMQEEGKRPVVIVGNIRNLSSEHIETGLFVTNIERELINSGRVTFVASREQREAIREERLDQQAYATEETARRLAAETGADFMMHGSIKTLVDQLEGRQIKLYQVDMELINLETNEKVWIGNKEIRKYIERSRSRW